MTDQSFNLQFKKMGLVCIFLLWSLFQFVKADLTVNVESHDFEPIRLNISTNLKDNYVVFEYVTQDNTIINHFLDYENSVQIVKAVILGEEDLGQYFSQMLCFVLPFNKTTSLLLDDVSKLRQKMPNSIRQADFDKGLDEIYMQYFIALKDSGKISKIIPKYCSDAALSIFTASNISVQGNLNAILKPFPNKSQSNHCNDVSDPEIETKRSSCMCKFEYCLLWYPCQLTYCKDKNSESSAENKCGIKTCKKCFRFYYFSRNRFFCTYYF